MIEGVIPTLPLETHHRRTLFAPKNDHSSYDADDREEQQDEDGSSSCYVPIKINVVDDNTPVVSMIVPSHNNNNHSSTSSCHCFEYYRESMPKDIQPTTTTTTATTTTTNAEKVRNKFVEELFPTAQDPQISGQKQRRTKIRQQKSRFRTTPVTFEELREADEEIYLKQQKDEPQPTASEFQFELRPKSWTFSGGSTTNNRRSPSPTRRSSWHLQPLTNLHPLNWRPLSNESLLHLNSLSTLPTIPEDIERRLLNSPMTPSNDNFQIGALSSSAPTDQQQNLDV